MGFIGFTSFTSFTACLIGIVVQNEAAFVKFSMITLSQKTAAMQHVNHESNQPVLTKFFKHFGKPRPFSCPLLLSYTHYEYPCL